MGTGPIYKNYYTRLVRKMAWYKILIHVLIKCSSLELRCVSLTGDAQNMLAQLIMGTWPIY